MTEGLSDFFNLLSKEKKKKKEDFDSLVGEVSLEEILKQLSDLKKEEEERKFLEKKKLEEENKKREEEKRRIEEENKINQKKEIENLIGDFNFNNVLTEVAKAKKEAKEKKISENISNIKKVEAIESFLFEEVEESSKVQKRKKRKTSNKNKKIEIAEEVKESEKTDIGDGDDNVGNQIIETPEFIDEKVEEKTDKNDKEKNLDLNKNFVTLDELQSHYRSFINKIQIQLSSLGGGGETRLQNLDDTDSETILTDGNFIKYDATSRKFIGSKDLGSALDDIDIDGGIF